MAQVAERVFVDCREHPSVNDCSLYISGRRDEVLDAAVAHAVSAHQHENTPELRAMLDGALKEEK